MDQDSLFISINNHETVIDLYENIVMINHVKEKEFQVYYTKEPIDLNYIRTL